MFESACKQRNAIQLDRMKSAEHLYCQGRPRICRLERLNCQQSPLKGVQALHCARRVIETERSVSQDSRLIHPLGLQRRERLIEILRGSGNRLLFLTTQKKHNGRASLTFLKSPKHV